MLIASPPRLAEGFRRAGLAAVVTALTVLAFRIGLQMTLPLWPGA